MYSPFSTIRVVLVLTIALFTFNFAKAQEPAPPDHPLFTGPVHEVPESLFDQEHVRLAIRFEQETGQIYGTAKIRIRPLDGAPDSLLLDARDLEIYSIQIGILDSLKQTAVYSNNTEGKISVYLDSLQLQSAPIELQLTYLAKPQTGLYFKHKSKRKKDGVHIWTDGVLTNTNQWLPFMANQSDLFTSEIIATVSPGISVLSNGRLTEQLETEDGMTLFHYVQDQPHSPKDIGLYTGQFDIDSTYTVLSNGFALPTYFWTSTGMTEDMQESLREIPNMLTFFSEYLNFTYPWPSYSVMLLDDVFIQDLSLTGLTILNASIVKDAKARSDSMEPFRLGQLVARQWYSHLVNTDFEADSWLTESISAYLSLLYIKSEYGEVPYFVHLYDFANQYFEESETYQRPLVWNQWDHPYQLFDKHSSGKGVWVLHSIHNSLGDEQFAGFLQFLTKSRAFTASNTDHVLELLSEFTRSKQDAFFDQWFYSAGHPDLEVDYQYDVVSESLYVSIEQIQDGYLVPAIFDLNLNIETYSIAGPESHTVQINSKDQLVSLPASMKPRYVIPAASHPYLMRVHVEQDASSWITQLRYASHPISQLKALRALEAYTEDPALLIGLQSALRSKPAPVVRAGIARLVSSLPHSDASQQTLIDAYEDDSPLVQKTVLEVLANFEDTKELMIMAMDAAQSSPSYMVQSEAVRTLAKIQGSDALGLVRSALITPSHNDIIRRKALESLFFINMSTQDRVEIAGEYTSPKYSPEARLAAIQILKTLASFDNRQSRRILLSLLSDEVYLIRNAVLDSFFEIGLERDLETLQNHMANEHDLRLYHKTNQVISRIENHQEAGSTP